MAARHLRRGPRNLAAGPLKPHIDSFVLYLRAEGRSRKTITLYSQAASWFAAEHLLTGGQPTDTDRRFDTADDTSADLVTFEPVRDWELVSRVHLRSWLVRLRHRRHTDSYVNNQYRCFQQFFRWLSAEEEIPSPMAKIRPPKIAPKPVPVFDEGDVDRILKMPKGSDRCAAKRVDVCKLRDSAILQLLKDTGLRLGAASIADRRAVVTGKGNRTRYVKFTHPKVFFNASPADATHLHQHTRPHLNDHDLSHLGAYQAVLRTLSGATELPPATLRTRPLPPAVRRRAHHIRKASRRFNAPPIRATRTDPRHAKGEDEHR
ncbi:tyrosine-type recombinase/integrase [Nocardiopsis sp. NPDC057823]|uniref:tyrosine-type recombinase/integrase n=1 Tax=Nocardiopsis sp. NPDC057823 TaxID=3346256 RepID=UPI00366F71D6